MRSLGQRLVAFLRREDGPTAVEYAVMLALIIVVCVTTLAPLRQQGNDPCWRCGLAPLALAGAAGSVPISPEPRRHRPRGRQLDDADATDLRMAAHLRDRLVRRHAVQVEHGDGFATRLLPAD